MSCLAAAVERDIPQMEAFKHVVKVLHKSRLVRLLAYISGGCIVGCFLAALQPFADMLEEKGKGS
jgi:hypothetical protein